MNASIRRILWVAAVLAVITGWGQKAWTQGQHTGAAADQAAAARALDQELWSALTPLDRQILKFVSESQLEELLNGIDPTEIYLSNGETLSDLTARTQAASSRNLLFAPVSPCRLIDTRLTSEGQLRPGETRGFRVRETETGYTEQGGEAAGCGLPGLDGLTLKTNVVRAVALNVLTVDVGGPGSLAIWPANRSEPEVGSVSFANALGGDGVTGGLLVAVCDEAGLDPCNGGDLKIKAKMSGAHVVAEVVGYFHAGGSGSTRIDSVVGDRKERGGDSGDDSFDAAGGNDEGAASGTSAFAAGARSGSAAGRPWIARTPTERGLEIADSEVPPLVQQILDGEQAPEGTPWERALYAELATGHGAGAAVDAFIQNDQNLQNASAVKGLAVTGLAIYGDSRNGRAIYGITRDGYGVYGFDGGSEANRGYGGYFYSTNGIGVYGYSNANRTHPNILAPGIYGQSNQGVGVYGRGDTSNTFSFFNEGGFFEGGKGLYALGTDSAGEQGYGARIFSSQYRGMYVQGASNWFDAYFGGNAGISTNGIIDRSASSMSLAVNRGVGAIETGDLVAMVGVVPSPESGQPMLAVAKVDASNRQAVIGVAKQAFSVEFRSEPNGKKYVDFAPIADARAVAPDGYLTIVTQGLAPAVNLTGSPQVSGWRIGDRIALGAGGALEPIRDAADAVSIGRLAAPADPKTGTIAIVVDID